MSDGIKLRLIAFVLAIGLIVWLIAWAAHTAWREVTELQQRVSAVHLKSFQIADHFQQTILGLNNTLLRYGVSHDPQEWRTFSTQSQALDRWIDDQRPVLYTEEEKNILDQINTAYVDYLAAAVEIHGRIGSIFRPATQLSQFADFEKQSRRVLNLAFKLADAHRESMFVFLARFNASLSFLRDLLLSSLFLLLLACGGLAAVLYRGTIAPLKVKLVETQQLAQRHEKLASLGLLAAGLAHEIRNPLTSIKAWLFIQQKHLLPATPEHEDARLIGNEINRLERIVHDFLLFARPSAPEFEVVPAGRPLQEVQNLLGPELQKSDIRLSLAPAPDASVRIDPRQIKQVLINLIRNAADSIGQDGDITLRARLDTKRVSDQTAEAVILEVIDTGKGISPEAEKRLFDPFFTTKEFGTGLGLSIAARIVEKHGGALQYQTQTNRGTTFGIVLPRA